MTKKVILIYLILQIENKDYLIKKLQQIQNYSARLIVGASKYQYITPAALVAGIVYSFQKFKIE